MIPSPETDKILELLIAEYEEDDGFKYTKSFDDSGFIEEEIKTTIEVYQDQMDSKVFDLLLNLSWYATDRCIYFALHKKDAELAKGELSRAIAYAYWATNYGAKACKCFGGRLEIPMKRMSLLFAINLLSTDFEKAEVMGKILISSLNAKNCIIKRGDEDALRSWFLIDLYSLFSGQEINKKISHYPKEYAPFDKILETWDSTDLELIDEKVSLLCDLHLAYAFSELSSENEDERKEEYEVPAFQIFPYEILGWLAIRAKKKIDNPKEFSHPLMNTPLASSLLDQEIAFAESENLPFAGFLLSKLKEICPDIK